MSRNVKSLLALAGLSIAALSGGCKKPPPQGACCSPDGSCSVTIQTACSGNWSPGVCDPNPCPQPAPPPPEEVTFDSVAQELKADPRVQFADGLMITVDEIDLGKAVVKLADALARGDDKAMGALLDRRAQGILSELQSTGEWKDATKGIEAVRVILVKGGMDLSGAAAVAAPQSDDLKALMAAAFAGLPEEQRKMIEGLMASMPNDASMIDAMKTQFANTVEQLKAAGVSDDVIAEAQKQLDALGAPANADSAASSSGSSVGVLMAVQESSGAYLLGWGAIKAGEHWVFTNAPTSADVRARASAFDGTGQEGFQAMTLASAVPDAARIDNSGNKGGGGAGGGDSGGGGGSPGPGGEGPGGPPASPPVQPPAAPPGSPKGPGRS